MKFFIAVVMVGKSFGLSMMAFLLSNFDGWKKSFKKCQSALLLSAWTEK